MRRITLILLLMTSYAWLIGQVNVVTYSPSNPEVGDVVTFTITAITPSCSYAVDADGDDPAVTLMALPGATHTYTAAGTYTVNLDEDCVFDDLASAKGIDTKALLPSSGWTLQDSDGTVSSDKTITIGAGNGTTAATIPTLGEWTLIILLISMIIVGVVFMVQKSDRKAMA